MTSLAAGLVALVSIAQTEPAPEVPAPAAPAPSGPVVLLWPEAGATPSATQEDALAAALGPRIKKVVRSIAVTASPVQAERERADGEDLGRAEAALATARKAYLAFDFDGARAAIEKLIADDLAVLSRPGQTPLLGEALRLAGEIELAAGRLEPARVRAGSAAFVLPEGAGRGLPPEYARLEGDARGDAQRVARRPLRIASNPSGADIEVDGRAAGRTPITVDVAPGDHVVRLEQPGLQVAAAIVAVSADGGALDLDLLPDPRDAVLFRRIARGSLDPEDTASRRALLARAGATHLVTYRATFEGVRAQVRSVATDKPIAVADARDAAGVAGRIGDAVLGLPRAPEGDGGAPLVAARPEPQPFYSRWWFWTAAAVVVAGAATAGFLLADRPAQHAIVKPK